ncbi:MAG: helix-turn-helix domain-containing protein [Ornithinimicrobium sp.]
MSEPWISLKEAGRRLGCSPRAVHDMVRRGDLAATPVPAGAAQRVRRLPSIDAQSVEALRVRRSALADQARLEREQQQAQLKQRQPPDDGHMWLSVSSTAAIAGLHRTRVNQLIKAGKLPALHRGNRWWIRRQDAEVFANARRFRQRQHAAASNRPRDHGDHGDHGDTATRRTPTPTAKIQDEGWNERSRPTRTDERCV